MVIYSIFSLNAVDHMTSMITGIADGGMKPG